jgi:hypothetical protein
MIPELAFIGYLKALSLSLLTTFGGDPYDR